MRGRAAKGNVTSAVSHKGGAHGVRARGMSVSQVIAASRRPLNRGSHLSGDTCHMMPRSLAPRAAYAGPHRTGVRPVRSLRGPSLVPKGPRRLISSPIGDRPPPSPTPARTGPTAFGRPGASRGSAVCGPPPKPRLRGRGGGHAPGRRGDVGAGAGVVAPVRVPVPGEGGRVLSFMGVRVPSGSGRRGAAEGSAATGALVPSSSSGGEKGVVRAWGTRGAGAPREGGTTALHWQDRC